MVQLDIKNCKNFIFCFIFIAVNSFIYLANYFAISKSLINILLWLYIIFLFLGFIIKNPIFWDNHHRYLYGVVSLERNSLARKLIVTISLLNTFTPMNFRAYELSLLCTFAPLNFLYNDIASPFLPLRIGVTYEWVVGSPFFIGIKNF